jgi:hypothetical protein
MNDISLSESKNSSDDEFPEFIQRHRENHGGSNPTEYTLIDEPSTLVAHL